MSSFVDDQFADSQSEGPLRLPAGVFKRPFRPCLEELETSALRVTASKAVTVVQLASHNLVKMASVSRAVLVFLLVGLLMVQHAKGQITFSKNWQPGKRGEICSQREAQAVIKLRQVLLEEAKLVAECRMFYTSDGASEE